MSTVYRGMDRVELDAAYNNRDAVRNSTEVSEWYITQSEITYRTLACTRDLRYGVRPAQRYDLFPVENSEKPYVIFIHGGYWQTRAKEHYACVAEGLVKNGFPVVLAEYTLAPEVTMSEIVGEIGGLINHLGLALADANGKPPEFILSGHSAGGHLSACFRGHPLVRGVLGISGVYELEPMRLSYLNESLQLSELDVQFWSPQRRISDGVLTMLAVGGSELPQFLVQSREYADALAAGQQPVHFVVVPSANHFTILDELVSQEGILTRLVEMLTRLTEVTVGRCQIGGSGEI